MGQPLSPGTILHNGDRSYRIEKVLGSGGFGITYMALGVVQVGNVTTEASFAIKEHFPAAISERCDGLAVSPAPGASNDYDNSKNDFISEACKLRAVGTLNKNIVKVNEVFLENGTAYYVMQYINGDSLKQYVESKGCLQWKEALSLMQPIFDAVDFLHSSSMNHLDIKPENIMLHHDANGITPILIDFGLCLHFNENGAQTTHTAITGISEGFSPAEQYEGIHHFSPQSDVYSLAATLLFALTGTEPKGANKIDMDEVRGQLDGVAPAYAIDGICSAMRLSPQERTASVYDLKTGLGLAEERRTAPIPTPPPFFRQTH